MVNLSQYYKEENWTAFYNSIVPIELDKSIFFYNYLKELDAFPEDINQVLASLYNYMFFGKMEVFERWLRTKHKMLDDNTPTEIFETIDGEKTLKEYLIRYPII